MSVVIEFISIVAKRTAIEQRYKGGIAAFIKFKGPYDCVIYDKDEYLYKEGTMSPSAAKDICSEYERAGLRGKSEDGKSWIDFCIIDELMGPTLECDWIFYDRKRRIAWHIDDQSEIDI